MLTINTWKMEEEQERKRYLLKRKLIWLSLLPLGILFWIVFSSCCFASIVINYNTKEIANIIYGEQSNPKATNALLNTYYHSKKKGETLEQSLKRQSCAYGFKSREYLKAKNNNLNEYEQKKYTKILKQVENFTPQGNWKYIKHESISFYNSFDEMIVKLRHKWGDSIDYKHSKLIEGQYYFKTLKG